MVAYIDIEYFKLHYSLVFKYSRQTQQLGFRKLRVRRKVMAVILYSNVKYYSVYDN
jgi:hypothetical protein